MEMTWSKYERKIRDAFDSFMKELRIGDVISIFHGEEMALDHVKVFGIEDKMNDYGAEKRLVKHLILQPKYGEKLSQAIDTAGSKTPWFDGPYIIHRDFRFETQK